LFDLLTKPVIKQERDLHFKLSHYATKFIIIVLVFKMTAPFLEVSISEAAEKMFASSFNILNIEDSAMFISKPQDGIYNYQSKSNLMASFSKANKMTESNLIKLNIDISNLSNDKEKISEEILATEKSIDETKNGLVGLLVEISNLEDKNLILQMLDGQKFSEILDSLSQNEVVYKSMNDLYQNLLKKQEILTNLRDELKIKDVVLKTREEEKGLQNNQLLAIKEGSSFFKNMDSEQFSKFVEDEKEKLDKFMISEQGDKNLNTKIYDQAIQNQENHFKNLRDSQTQKIVNTDLELEGIERVMEKDKEGEIEDISNYLSGNIILEQSIVLNLIDKLIQKVDAKIDPTVQLIATKLQSSTKLTSQEKKALKKIQTQRELKVFLVGTLTRIKKEKEAEKNKIIDSLAYNSMQKSGKAKVLPNGKKVFTNNPLKTNPVYVTATFGDKAYEKRIGMFHNGIDLGVAQKTPIYAVSDGVVKSTVIDSTPTLAYMILIHKDESKMSAYLHLSKVLVKEGDIIKKGQLVAYSGGTPGTAGAGLSTGPHLHFEVREIDNSRVDPYPAYLPDNPPVFKFIGF